jgi:multidrug efflux system outer membrane protein
VTVGLTGPIFTFGAIEGRLRTAEAAQREAVSFYQQTIFNAFRETNNALVGTLKKRQEAEAQARRVLALREYARLSRLRFDNGAASYIEVLYAENELFSARLASIQSKALQYSELVNVFNAMGGGWVTEADRLAPSPAVENKAPAR